MLSFLPSDLVDCSRATPTSTQRWGFQSLHQRSEPLRTHTDWWGKKERRWDQVCTQRHENVSNKCQIKVKRLSLTLLLSSGFLLISSLCSCCCCCCSLQAADWTGVSDNELVRGPDRQTHESYRQTTIEITHTVCLYTCNSWNTHKNGQFTTLKQHRYTDINWYLLYMTQINDNVCE